MTESSGAGNVAASADASSRDRFGEAHRADRPDEPVDLGVDRGRHPRMRVAERGHGDPVGEVEVRLAVRVVQAVAVAVAPVAGEVAAEDGRQVRGGLHGPRVQRPAGAPRSGSVAGTSGHPATIGCMVEFTLSDENRLVQQSARAFAEAEILPVHPRVGREGRGPPRGLREDGRARLPGRADPRGVRRVGDGLHQLRDPVRGAGACRHLVPCRPERPCRAQLARAPPVGDRGAAPALARPAGARREARHVRTDRARRRHRRRQPGDDRPTRRRRVPAQRPEDLDLTRRPRRPFPRVRLGGPVEEAQGRDRVHARARDARPDDGHAPRQARDPGRQHRDHQPR